LGAPPFAVAAAIEGRFLGLPALAISLCTTPAGARRFDTAGRVAHDLVAALLRRPLDPTLILNVNVPDRPYESLRGYASTRLGFRHRSEAVIAAQDPKGNPVYWMGPAGPGNDAGAGTDFDAVANGFVSVTPLAIDFTRHAALPEVGRWLEGL